MPDRLSRKESELFQVSVRYIGLVYLAGSKEALGFGREEIDDLIGLLESTEFKAEKRSRHIANLEAAKGAGCCSKATGVIAIETGKTPKGRRNLELKQLVCCVGGCGGECPGGNEHDCVHYYDTNGVLDCRCDGAEPLVTTASGRKKWSRGNRQV